jgi:small neutral amino acid transporter SnatA (MarC family)
MAAAFGSQILVLQRGLDDFRIGGGLLALFIAGINIVTRVMALIVASLGVNFILTGLKNQLPGLLQ